MANNEEKLQTIICKSIEEHKALRFYYESSSANIEEKLNHKR